MRTMAIYILVMLMLSWPSTIVAQDDMPEPMASTEVGPGPPPPGLVVPIDSGIPILLISGLLLGIYFVLTCRRKTP